MSCSTVVGRGGWSGVKYWVVLVVAVVGVVVGAAVFGVVVAVVGVVDRVVCDHCSGSGVRNIDESIIKLLNIVPTYTYLLLVTEIFNDKVFLQIV